MIETVSELIEFYEENEEIDEEEKELKKIIRKFSRTVNNYIPKGKKRGDQKKDKKGVYHFFSFNLRHKGDDCLGVITNKYFCIVNQSKKPFKMKRFPHDEMFGIHRISDRSEDEEEDTSHGLYLATLDKKSRKVFTNIVFTKSAEEETRLVSTLQQVSLLGRKKIKDRNKLLDKGSRRMLVIINPAAGSKKSESIFKKEVEPILKDCHLEYTSVVTKYAGHGVELCRNLNIEEEDSDSDDDDEKKPFPKYTEIMSVGGDGMFHEIITGLFSHPKMNYTEVKKIPLSLIPCGTGNALSCGMGCDQNARLSALIAARGRTVPYDVMSIISQSEKYVSFLFFAYGVIPDVDFGYQAFSFLGDLKYAIGGFCSCVARTQYPMKVHYISKEGEDGDVLDSYEFPYDRILNLFSEKGEIKFLGENEEKTDPPLDLLEEHFGDELKEMLESIESKKKKKKKEESEDEEEGEEEESEEEEEESSEEVEEGGEPEEEEEESSTEEEGEGARKKKEESEEDHRDEEEKSSPKKKESGSSEEEEEEEDKDEEKQEEVIEIADIGDEENEGEEDESESESEESESRTVVQEMTKPLFFLSISNSRKFAYDMWASGNITPGNGYVDMVYIEGKPGFFEALGAFLKMMASEPDGHLKTGVFEGKRILGFRFEALGPKFSHVDVDGEEKPIEPVLGMVHPRLLRICHIENDRLM